MAGAVSQSVSQSVSQKIVKSKLALSSLFLGSLFVFSPAYSASLEDGLIAYWNFDDCTAKDSSQNQLDGTIIGDPKCVSGVMLNGANGVVGITNKALEFDGNDAIERLYMDIPAG